MEITRQIKLLILVICEIVALSVTALTAQEKPPLGEKDLEQYTYYFDIADNKFTGDGAKFLTDEIGKNQFILLGEYHDSRRISEFAKSVIPLFYNAGGRNFALEIGPVSAEILSGLAAAPAKTAGNLRAFNNRYYVQGSKRRFTPIPFFESVGAAEFLAEASAEKLNIIGLDQEFSYGYAMLIDRMYENLSSRRKKRLASLHDRAVAAMKKIYDDYTKNTKNLFVAFSESVEINKFLDEASIKNPQNQRIAEALKISNRIYLDGSVNRKYLLSNETRASYMKKNLSEGLARLKFDFRKDKLLLKIGGNHAARGFSPARLYDVGNTLSELAAYNGNTSLHIKFGMRFYAGDGGKESDMLDNQKGYPYLFQSLLQMGRKDRWTLIDLRPLREVVFYKEKYKLTDEVLDVFRNFDFYVIPKLETAPELNIDSRDLNKTN